MIKITAIGSRTVYSETGKATTRKLELRWKSLSAKAKSKPANKRRKAS